MVRCNRRSHSRLTGIGDPCGARRTRVCQRELGSPVCVGATNTAQEPVVEETTTTTTEAPAPKSSLSVDFVSTASSASTVSATCGELTESASGTEISLSITGIAQSTGCVVAYPATLECTMAIDPTSVTGAAAPGVQNLLMPAVGAVDAAMTIDCVEPQVASVVETTTTTAPAAAAPTTTVAPTTEKVAVEVEVADQVETAPAATAQTGQPAFTG